MTAERKLAKGRTPVKSEFILHPPEDSRYTRRVSGESVIGG
jgi:hypothetical protein